MHPINPGPGLLGLGGMSVDAGRVVIRLVPLNKTAACPRCGRNSRRVHSRYWRRAADVPLSGNRVEVVIEARKFFCDTGVCSRKIFCERFSGVLEPYARFTERAKALLLEIGHASGAEQAAGVARLFGFKVSGATLITYQRRERFHFEPPQVIGVDEFAWRRGSRYGTIVVDLERRRPVDILPTDSVGEFSHWLGRHAPVAVIARDRDESFALAARDSAPGAIQVADRFHLAKNVLDAFREFVLSRKWKGVGQDHLPRSAALPEPPGPQPTARRRLTWERVQELAKEGHSIRAIARSLGMNRRTVRTWMSSSAPTPRRVSARPLRMLGPYMGYMLARWDQGVHNSALLYREVAGQGYEGSYSMLRRVVGRWRKEGARTDGTRFGPPLRLAKRWRRDLSEEETAELDRFLGANPELAAAYSLKESFREAMAARDQQLLDRWLDRAATSGTKRFNTLARGMRRDYAAVSAAFTSPWSNGQTEGQNTRLKLIKRLGYGRANPDLLRARVLHRAKTTAA